MKGMTLHIYRSHYDCTINAMHGKIVVTLVGPGIPEIFEVDDDAPAVMVFEKPSGYRFLAPPDYPERCYAFGGTYAASCDSRVSHYGALPIHDRQMWLE
jgi:hypothetical protein